MKKTLIVLLIAVMGINISAEMRYNPINNLLYSHPETPEINQDEYRTLILWCIELEARIIAMNRGLIVSQKDVLDQCNFYLKAIGTATAHRLMKDLKKNKVYYTNGSFMKEIFS